MVTSEYSENADFFYIISRPSKSNLGQVLDDWATIHRLIGVPRI